MAELEGFLNRFAKSEEAPEVWFQLGSSNEFNAEEGKAREDYTKLIESFPDTPSGKKAAGALRRLDLVGKPSPSRERASRARRSTPAVPRQVGPGRVLGLVGRPVGQARAPRPGQALRKFHAKGLEIVGVSLDNEKADLEAFLKEQPMSWPQIFEPGGIDSRLATEYGIISLPTMFLVDGQGKVVNRSLRTASEVERRSRSCSPSGSPAWPWAIAEPSPRHHDDGDPSGRRPLPREVASGFWLLIGTAVLPFLLPAGLTSVLLGSGSSSFVLWLAEFSYRDLRNALHYPAYPHLQWIGIRSGEGPLRVAATCLIGIVAPVSGWVVRLAICHGPFRSPGRPAVEGRSGRSDRRGGEAGSGWIGLMSRGPLRLIHCGVPGRHCPPAVKPIILSLRGRSR